MTDFIQCEHVKWSLGLAHRSQFLESMVSVDQAVSASAGICRVYQYDPRIAHVAGLEPGQAGDGIRVTDFHQLNGPGSALARSLDQRIDWQQPGSLRVEGW